MNYIQYPEDQIEYIAIFEHSELANGERINIEIDEHTITVFNIANKYFAIADVCSHDNQSLEDGDIENEFEIICPRHGAKFDIRNGKVLALPANQDIPAYPIRIINNMVEIGIPIA